MSEKVLVCKRDRVSLPVQRFSRKLATLENVLLVAEYMSRDEAECNDLYTQLIPYSILRFEDLVFMYKRQSGGSEQRLYGRFALGVGGHVNPKDTANADHFSENLIDVIINARDRELAEEFDFEYSLIPQLIGLIYDPSNSFGRMHIGIVYEYWVNSVIVISKEEEKHAEASFLPISEVIKREAEFENWSQIIIRDYLARTKPRTQLLRHGVG